VLKDVLLQFKIFGHRLYDDPSILECGYHMATRPITILGAGTLGRRIALMLATGGAEVRLYARSAATRDAGVAFAREQLPAVLAKLPGSKAGTIVGVGDMVAVLKDAWIIVESVPEDLELKKDIFKHVDALSEPDAILASDSSSYSSPLPTV
jgi:3-hydroxybutyryl-CoA dehydrogenase